MALANDHDVITSAKSIALRDEQGRLIAGHPNGNRFKKGEVANPKGRIYPSDQVRKGARAAGDFAVEALIDIASDKTHNHIAYRLQAIAMLFEYGYGKPDIATIIKYEVDLIIERLGLPKRSQLIDKHGNHIFGRQGGYIPSGQMPAIRHEWPERDVP